MTVFLKTREPRQPHDVTLGMEYDFVSETGVMMGQVKFVRTPPYNTGMWWATWQERTAFGPTRHAAIDKLLEETA